MVPDFEQPPLQIPESPDEPKPYVVRWWRHIVDEAGQPVAQLLESPHALVEDAVEEALTLRLDKALQVEGVFDPEGEKVLVPWVRSRG